MDKLEVENRTFTKITGDAHRLQKRMINKTALREALINAIVHNDYTKEIPPVVEIYSDRLTITSYGGLVLGLSKKEFFQGRSMPRNREIMRVYRDLDLVEQLGSGMNRILNVYSNDIYKFSDNFIEVCFYYEKEYDQVTDQVKKLLSVFDNDWLSSSEIMTKLELSNKATFRNNYLKPALKSGLIIPRDPDSPRSPKQKYKKQ